MKVYICTTCSADSEPLLEKAQRALPDVAIEGVDCMSGCTRPQAIAVRAKGKVAYLFGDMSDADLHDLKRFTALYAASPDGRFEDARVLGGLRLKALARIPS